MTIAPALFSSASDNWATPQTLFDALNAEFRFTLDVCADETNAKCANWLGAFKYIDGTRGFTNGLTHTWQDVCWMNPPYGEPEQPCKSNCRKKRCTKRGYHVDKYVPGIIDWMRKAYESSLQGVTVVCLVPARTCTTWWHRYAMKADEIRFIEGRLTFGDAENVAPFPSAIIVFRPHITPRPPLRHTPRICSIDRNGVTL